MGWHGGSQGEVRRMRAAPAVPVEVAWRWGRNSGHKLAESWRRFICPTADNHLGWHTNGQRRIMYQRRTPLDVRSSRHR